MWFLACVQAPVWPFAGVGGWLACTLSGQLVRRERWIMTRLNLIGSCSNARGRCLDVNCLLYDFSMQREVEALAFDILRHPQADEHLDHEQHNHAHDGIINKPADNTDAFI